MQNELATTLHHNITTDKMEDNCDLKIHQINSQSIIARRNFAQEGLQNSLLDGLQ